MKRSDFISHKYRPESDCKKYHYQNTMRVRREKSTQQDNFATRIIGFELSSYSPL